MKLTHWKKGYIERVYLNDVPGVTGKAFLHLNKGKLVFTADTITSSMNQILDTLAEVVGVGADAGDKAFFEALVDFANTPAARLRVALGSSPLPSRSNPFGGQAAGLDLNFRNIENAQPVLIEIDHREPEGIEDVLSQVENLVVERKHLPLGDFIINRHILVERKTVTDFALSVQSGHVFDQAQRMGFEDDVHGVVVVEGPVFGGETGMLHSAVTGALTCLSFVQRMSLFNTLNLEHTCFLVAMGQHDLNGLGYPIPLHKSKPKALLNAQRYVIEAIPGISAGLATVLLEHFGSVQAVLVASEEQLKQVKGMGPKTIAKLRDVASSPYRG